ncbi:ISSth2 transposase [Desmospora sp. 8437]|nr:ISSth2 transposase [Desmospora sp. 8437]
MRRIARGRKKTLRLKLDVSTREWRAVIYCLERRVNELRMKVREGDRKGRGVERYLRELSLLELVLLQVNKLDSHNRDHHPYQKKAVDKK